MGVGVVGVVLFYLYDALGPSLILKSGAQPETDDAFKLVSFKGS